VLLQRAARRVEAYLNSLEIKDWRVLSSGTVAASNKAGNLPYYRMTLDLLEKRGIREFAYGECLRLVTFPASPRIWSVADIGEPGRVSNSESERLLYREDAYQEIVANVDRLIADIPVERDGTRWTADDMT
jgi:hypothetical protein